MGANVSTAISNATTDISTEIDQHATASSDCSDKIKTGNITISGHSNNCPITLNNKCVAAATTTIDAVAKAAAKTAQKATPKQKTGLIPGWNVSFSDQQTKTAIKNKLTQDCAANVSADSSIVVGDITIAGTCRNSPILMNNSGTARGNCAINSVVNAINDNSQLFAPTQTTGSITAILEALMAALLGPVGAAVGASSLSVFILCCCVICVFLLIFAMGQMK